MDTTTLHSILLLFLSLVATGAIPWAMTIVSRMTRIEQAVVDHRRRVKGHSDRLDSHDDRINAAESSVGQLQSWKKTKEETGHIDHEKRITAIETKLANEH